jgi:FtsH-binding integral membrane protein
MSIYGYTTKKDLSSMGSILMMGVFGLLIASIVNIFMHSSAMMMAISFLSVILFTALVAYDTQRLRQMYYALNNTSLAVAQKFAIMGAMQLYIDFIAIFVNLLQLIRGMSDNR